MSGPPELPPPVGSGAPPELTGRQKTLQALERRRRFQNGKPEPGREWEDDQRWWGPVPEGRNVVPEGEQPGPNWDWDYVPAMWSSPDPVPLTLQLPPASSSATTTTEAEDDPTPTADPPSLTPIYGALMVPERERPKSIAWDEDPNALLRQQQKESGIPPAPWMEAEMSEERRRRLNPDVDRSHWDIHRWKDYNDFRVFVRARLRRYPKGVLGKQFRALAGFKGKKQRRRIALLGFHSLWALLHSMPDLIVITEKLHPTSPLHWVYAPATHPLELPPGRLPLPDEVLARPLPPQDVDLFEGPSFLSSLLFKELDHIPFPVPDYAVLMPRPGERRIHGRMFPVPERPHRLMLRPGFAALRQIMRECMQWHPEGMLLLDLPVLSGMYLKPGIRLMRSFARGKAYTWRDLLLGMPDLVSLRGRSNDCWVYPAPRVLEERPWLEKQQRVLAIEQAVLEGDQGTAAGGLLSDGNPLEVSGDSAGPDLAPTAEANGVADGLRPAAADPAAATSTSQAAPATTAETVTTAAEFPWAPEEEEDYELPPPPPLAPEWQDVRMPPLGPLPALSYFWIRGQKDGFNYLRDLLQRYLQMNQQGLLGRQLAGLPGFESPGLRRYLILLGFNGLWGFLRANPDIVTIMNINDRPHNWRLKPTDPIVGLPRHAVRPPDRQPLWETNFSPGKPPKQRRHPFSWWHPNGFCYELRPAHLRRPSILQSTPTPPPAAPPEIRFFDPRRRRDRTEWELDLERIQDGQPDREWDRDRWERDWAWENFKGRRTPEEGAVRPPVAADVEDTGPTATGEDDEAADPASLDGVWLTPREGVFQSSFHGPLPPRFPVLSPDRPFFATTGTPSPRNPSAPSPQPAASSAETEADNTTDNAWQNAEQEAPWSQRSTSSISGTGGSRGSGRQGRAALQDDEAEERRYVAAEPPAQWPPASETRRPRRSRGPRLPFVSLRPRTFSAAVLPPTAAPEPASEEAAATGLAPPWRQRPVGWDGVHFPSVEAGPAAPGQPPPAADVAHPAAPHTPLPAALPSPPWGNVAAAAQHAEPGWGPPAWPAPTAAWPRPSQFAPQPPETQRGPWETPGAWPPAAAAAAATQWAGPALETASPSTGGGSAHDVQQPWHTPWPGSGWGPPPTAAPQPGGGPGADGYHPPREVFGAQSSVPLPQASDVFPTAAVPWRRAIRYRRWDKPSDPESNRNRDLFQHTPDMPGTTGTLLGCQCPCHRKAAPRPAGPNAHGAPAGTLRLALHSDCVIA